MVKHTNQDSSILKKQSKKKVLFCTIFILGLLFIIFNIGHIKSALNFSTHEQRFEELNKAQREIINNTKFSEEDINQAMDTVLEKISKNRRFAVDRIWYDQNDSDERLRYFQGDIVIGVNINEDKYLSNDNFSDIWYYLKKDDNNNWTIIDSGRP